MGTPISGNQSKLFLMECVELYKNILNARSFLSFYRKSLIIPEKVLQNEAVDSGRSLWLKAKQLDDKLKHMIRSKAGEEQMNNFFTICAPTETNYKSNGKQSFSNKKQISILKRNLKKKMKDYTV